MLSMVNFHNPYFSLISAMTSSAFLHWPYTACFLDFISNGNSLWATAWAKKMDLSTKKHRHALPQAGNQWMQLSVPDSPDIQLLLHLYRFCCHISHIVFGFAPVRDWAWPHWRPPPIPFPVPEGPSFQGLLWPEEEPLEYANDGQKKQGQPDAACRLICKPGFMMRNKRADAHHLGLKLL